MSFIQAVYSASPRKILLILYTTNAKWMLNALQDFRAIKNLSKHLIQLPHYKERKLRPGKVHLLARMVSASPNKLCVCVCVCVCVKLN